MHREKTASMPKMQQRSDKGTAVARGDDRRSIALPYANEEDVRAALENFRSYLKILQEWDNRERERQCTRSEDVG